MYINIGQSFLYYYRFDVFSFIKKKKINKEKTILNVLPNFELNITKKVIYK